MAGLFRGGKAGYDANKRMYLHKYLHRGSQKQNQCLSRTTKLAGEHVSEVDLMSGIYSMSLHRRTVRRAERIQSLRQIPGQIVVGIERTLHRMFNRDGSLIPIPVKAVADRRRLDRYRIT